jgi:hypothetical protein
VRFRAAVVAVAALVPGVASSQSAPSHDSTSIVQAVELRRYDIFAPSEATNFFARAANGLHITTRPRVVRRELLFRTGEPYDSARVAETARNLRSLGIFRSVRIDSVRSDSGLLVRVTTGDGWSTRPLFNIQSTGGTFTPTVGIEELNFLGTATLASIRYKSDPDRSTITTVFRQPRLFAGRVGVTFLYAHLSDGDIGQAQLSKPFFSLSQRNSWQVGVDVRDHRVLQFFDGVPDARDTLRHRAALGYAAAAWALRAGSGGYVRLGLSGQVRREDFAADVRADTIAKTVTGAVGPFMQWRRARFLVSQGLQGFAREEDIDVSTSAGIGLTLAPRAFGYADDGIVPFVSFQTGFGRPGAFVQLSAIGEGRYTRAGLDSGSVHLAGTAYFQPGPRHLAVVYGAVGWMKDPEPGAEFDLGGIRGGPRGIRDHFFTGNRAFFTSTEYRYTVTNDFLKLTAIGVAGWADYGGAWYAGSARRAKASVGGGLRFGPTRATDIRSSRVDVACRNREDDGRFRCILVIGQGFAFSSNGRLDR